MALDSGSGADASVGVVVLIAALFGALSGVLVPTPAYRLAVQRGEPPRSTCRSCPEPFAVNWQGWLRFGSTCRACAARSGPPAGLVAGLSALVCAGLAWRFGASLVLLPFLALVPVALLLAVIDLRCLRLPDTIVLPAVVVSLVAFAGTAAVTGAWAAFGRGVVGALAIAGGYLVIALLPGKFGGGDIMLGGLLGVYLGYLGWPVLLFGALLPFLVFAPVALGLLVAQRAGRRTELPFGPALLVGAYLTVVGLPAMAAAAA